MSLRTGASAPIRERPKLKVVILRGSGCPRLGMRICIWEWILWRMLLDMAAERAGSWELVGERRQRDSERTTCEAETIFLVALGAYEDLQSDGEPSVSMRTESEEEHCSRACGNC